MSAPSYIWRVGSETPEATALVWGCRSITYGELIQRASSIGDVLLDVLGSRSDSPVAICTDEAPQMIMAALGGWRARHGYLPLDPGAPEERSDYMLKESGVRLVLAKKPAMERFRSRGWQVLPLDEFTSGPLQPGACCAEESTPAADDLAYVIYTSGSTGKPKGVAVTQANLTHLVDWYGSAFEMGRGDRVTQMAALTFDASVLEIWTALSQGATLLMPDRALAMQPEKLRDYLVEQRVTISFVSTAVAEQLISLCWPRETKLRFLLTGGDALCKYPPAGLPFALINNYGPTECTVLATCGQVPTANRQKNPPSIGYPTRGAKVLILGSDFQPVKDGGRGEIFISGNGVAAGYIGQPELTAERFLQRPGVMGGLRLYRTGDWGRKLPSGEFEYLGRVDEQIKIRGYRIEPAEIVTVLRAHPAVAAAAILPWGSADTRQLIAYVSLRRDVDGPELRNYLKELLPAYMIPDCFVRVDRMPLLDSGKIDRSALPEPTRSNVLELPVEAEGEPAGEIQVRITSILSSLLEGRELRPLDNFFRLGANSLLVAQVIARIRQEFGIELPFRAVFDSPTVFALSAEVERLVLKAIEALPLEELLEEQP